MRLPVFLFLVLLLFCAPVHAQLSQLDFDDPAEKESGTKVEPPEPASTPKKVKPEVKETPIKQNHSSDKPPVETEAENSVSGAIKAPQEKAVLSPPVKKEKRIAPFKVEKTKLKGELNGVKLTLPAPGPGNMLVVIPVRDPLPKTDTDDLLTLTSKTTWEKPEGGKCWVINDKKDTLRKALAIKEVLERFTGGHGYYHNLREKYCSSDCSEQEKALVTGLAVISEGGGNFGIEESGNGCIYKLTKPLEANWNVFTLEKLVCHCIPLDVSTADPNEPQTKDLIDLAPQDQGIVIPSEFKNTTDETKGPDPAALNETE